MNANTQSISISTLQGSISSLKSFITHQLKQRLQEPTDFTLAEYVELVADRSESYLDFVQLVNEHWSDTPQLRDQINNAMEDLRKDLVY